MHHQWVAFSRCYLPVNRLRRQDNINWNPYKMQQFIAHSIQRCNVCNWTKFNGNKLQQKNQSQIVSWQSQFFVLHSAALMSFVSFIFIKRLFQCKVFYFFRCFCASRLRIHYSCRFVHADEEKIKSSVSRFFIFIFVKTNEWQRAACDSGYVNALIKVSLLFPNE